MRSVEVLFVMACGAGIAGPALAQETIQTTQAIKLPTITIGVDGTYPDGSSAASGGLVVPKPSFGPLGDLPERQVPFATNSIPKAVLDDQITHYGAQALMNDPSVQSAPTTGGITEFYRIRGFSNQNMIRVDGLPLQIQDDPGFYDYERVDILKGATSVLYGFADPAGVVNYISKKPLDGPLTQVDLAYGSLAFGTGHIDVNRRYGDGGVLGVRVNLEEEGGETSIRPQTLHHNMESIAVDFRPTPDFKAWARYEHDDETTRGLQGEFFLGTNDTTLPPVPNTNKLILPTYTFEDEEAHTAIAGFEWNPTGWQINGAIGYVTQTFFYDFAQVGDGTLNSNGTFDYIPFTSKHVTNIGAYRINATRTLQLGSVVSDDISLSNTGTHQSEPLLSAQNIGASLGEDSVIAPINFANPNVSREFTNMEAQDTYLESVDLIDRLHLGDKISLWGGGIYSYVDTQTLGYTATPLTFTNLAQGKVTPVAAVLFNPVPTVTAYFSYIEALQEGQTAPSTAVNANQTLPPFVGSQYEAGVKTELHKGLEIDTDVFTVSEANAYLDPTDNVFKASGTQVDKGVEFTVRGQVTERLKAFGGFMFMDAKVHTDPTSYMNNGPAPNVANVRGNLFLEYLIPGLHGVSLLAGGYYTGNSFTDTGVSYIRVPNYATYDVGAKYETVVDKVPTVFRLYATNILNAQYWQTFTGVQPGDPRTVRLSASMRF